jgi:protease I
MTSGKLQGIRIAVLVSNGFKEFELLDTKRSLDQAGAATFVVGPTKGKVKGLNPTGGEAQVPVDIPLKSAMPQDFHALLLPGGSTNVKNLSLRTDAIEFVKDFMIAGKPVASIGEAAAILIQTGTLRGRMLTADASLEQDLRRAGANYIDKNIACDGNLITARRLDDIPAFNRELMRVLAELRAHSSEMRRIA